MVRNSSNALAVSVSVPVAERGGVISETFCDPGDL
jgi:hypothetical protein